MDLSLSHGSSASHPVPFERPAKGQKLAQILWPLHKHWSARIFSLKNFLSLIIPAILGTTGMVNVSHNWFSFCFSPVRLPFKQTEINISKNVFLKKTWSYVLIAQLSLWCNRRYSCCNCWYLLIPKLPTNACSYTHCFSSLLLYNNNKSPNELMTYY